jgi:hypothetical protein
MKHKIYILLTIFCLALTAAAQSRQPKTVEDFYMALPAKYISPLGKVKDRRKLIQTSDIANGYLYLSAENASVDWEGWAEIALFKKTSGEYLIGVVDGDCATLCYSGVEFLEYKNGKWTETTKKVLPEISDEMILARYKKLFPGDTEFDRQNPPSTNYKLPQKGTTLIMNANTGGDADAELFQLVWNGARFNLKK